VLPVSDIRPVPVPIDCTDGFGAAHWGRPEAYLDEGVQAGISWLAQLSDAPARRGSARLARDPSTGAWGERHGHLRDLDELDVGYRLLGRCQEVVGVGHHLRRRSAPPWPGCRR
jgi:hypothetical protein